MEKYATIPVTPIKLQIFPMSELPLIVKKKEVLHSITVLVLDNFTQLLVISFSENTVVSLAALAGGC